MLRGKSRFSEAAFFVLWCGKFWHFSKFSQSKNISFSWFSFAWEAERVFRAVSSLNLIFARSRPWRHSCRRSFVCVHFGRSPIPKFPTWKNGFYPGINWGRWPAFYMRLTVPWHIGGMGSRWRAAHILSPLYHRKIIFFRRFVAGSILISRLFLACSIFWFLFVRSLFISKILGVRSAFVFNFSKLSRSKIIKFSCFARASISFFLSVRSRFVSFSMSHYAAHPDEGTKNFFYNPKFPKAIKIYILNCAFSLFFRLAGCRIFWFLNQMGKCAFP